MAGVFWVIIALVPIPLPVLFPVVVPFPVFVLIPVPEPLPVPIIVPCPTALPACIPKNGSGAEGLSIMTQKICEFQYRY
jgi:hypothetical protein